MKENNTIVISDNQKNIYMQSEKLSASEYVSWATDIIDNFPRNESIKILDIGGGSGTFAYKLKEKYDNLEIVVVDNVEYDSWKTSRPGVRFVKRSAFDIDSIFKKGEIDIIFCNLVFHHLIQDAYSTTVKGQMDLLEKIGAILKDNGIFCVYECYYGGFIFRDYFSRIVYLLTHTNNRLLLKVSRFFGSDSAGIGVCFHSPKKWKKMFRNAHFAIVQEIIVSDNMMKYGLINERFFRFFLEKNVFKLSLENDMADANDRKTK